MQILPIDIVALVSVVLGISIVLVPVIGITARFALSPTVEALSKLFESRSKDESLRILERRMELQEQEITMLTQAVRSLAEGQEFDRALTSSSEGPSTAERPTGSDGSGHAPTDHGSPRDDGRTTDGP